MIAVTVDLLTTGVDIPDLEFLVLLRPVKSRILFEQMLGRGTRKGERYPDKSHFTVFDCFDGTLLEYFRKTTGITEEPADRPGADAPRDRRGDLGEPRHAYNVGCLVKRLQRIDREMPGEAREMLAAWVPDGDLARFARELPRALRQDYVATMKRLRDAEFQEMLLRLPRPDRSLHQGQRVPGHGVVGLDGARRRRPDLQARGLPDRLLALRRPRTRTRSPRSGSCSTALATGAPPRSTELRQKLAAARQHFTLENLQKAHELRHQEGPRGHHLDGQARGPRGVAAPDLRRARRRWPSSASPPGRPSRRSSRPGSTGSARVMQANLSIDREDFEYQDALVALRRLGRRAPRLRSGPSRRASPPTE